MATIKPTSNISTSQLKPDAGQDHPTPGHTTKEETALARAESRQEHACCCLTPHHLQAGRGQRMSDAASTIGLPVAAAENRPRADVVPFPTGRTRRLSRRGLPWQALPTSRSGLPNSSSPARCSRPVLIAFFGHKGSVLWVLIYPRKGTGFSKLGMLRALRLGERLQLIECRTRIINSARGATTSNARRQRRSAARAVVGPGQERRSAARQLGSARQEPRVARCHRRAPHQFAIWRLRAELSQMPDRLAARDASCARHRSASQLLPIPK